MSEADRIGPGGAGADDDAARHGARIAIGREQAAEERRRAVGAADEGLREGKGERARDRRHEMGVALGEGHKAGIAQGRRDGEHDEHEHAAVDRALHEAVAPMAVDRDKARRPRRERVEREAGGEMDQPPQTGLRERGEQRAEPDRRHRRGDVLGEIGQKRRQRAERGDSEHEPVQLRRSHEAANAHQRQDFEPDFARAEQNQGAADENLALKRRHEARPSPARPVPPYANPRPT